jgi:hypothetical protein
MNIGVVNNGSHTAQRGCSKSFPCALPSCISSLFRLLRRELVITRNPKQISYQVCTYNNIHNALKKQFSRRQRFNFTHWPRGTDTCDAEESPIWLLRKIFKFTSAHDSEVYRSTPLKDTCFIARGTLILLKPPRPLRDPHISVQIDKKRGNANRDTDIAP